VAKTPLAEASARAADRSYQSEDIVATHSAVRSLNRRKTLDQGIDFFFGDFIGFTIHTGDPIFHP
jgi:hypothetical protein